MVRSFSKSWSSPPLALVLVATILPRFQAKHTLFASEDAVLPLHPLSEEKEPERPAFLELAALDEDRLFDFQYSDGTSVDAELEPPVGIRLVTGTIVPTPEDSTPLSLQLQLKGTAVGSTSANTIHQNWGHVGDVPPFPPQFRFSFVSLKKLVPDLGADLAPPLAEADSINVDGLDRWFRNLVVRAKTKVDWVAVLEKFLFDLEHGMGAAWVPCRVDSAPLVFSSSSSQLDLSQLGDLVVERVEDGSEVEGGSDFDLVDSFGAALRSRDLGLADAQLVDDVDAAMRLSFASRAVKVRSDDVRMASGPRPSTGGVVASSPGSGEQGGRSWNENALHIFQDQAAEAAPIKQKTSRLPPRTARAFDVEHSFALFALDNLHESVAAKLFDMTFHLGVQVRRYLVEYRCPFVNDAPPSASEAAQEKVVLNAVSMEDWKRFRARLEGGAAVRVGKQQWKNAAVFNPRAYAGGEEETHLNDFKKFFEIFDSPEKLRERYKRNPVEAFSPGPSGSGGEITSETYDFVMMALDFEGLLYTFKAVLDMHSGGKPGNLLNVFNRWKKKPKDACAVFREKQDKAKELYGDRIPYVSLEFPVRFQDNQSETLLRNSGLFKGFAEKVLNKVIVSTPMQESFLGLAEAQLLERSWTANLMWQTDTQPFKMMVYEGISGRSRADSDSRHPQIFQN